MNENDITNRKLHLHKNPSLGYNMDTKESIGGIKCLKKIMIMDAQDIAV
jgi:hypothetical protein